MAEITTLARPYAKAVFECARESKQLDDWSKALKVSASVSSHQVFAKLLVSPKLTSEQKATKMISICGDELNDKHKAFIKVLASNKRLELIPAISELFEKFKAQQQKFSNIKVLSAYELDSDVEKLLAEKLKSVLQNDVSLRTEVDQSLLGGVIIRSGDMVIDGSVKGRLNKLAEALGL